MFQRERKMVRMQSVTKLIVVASLCAGLALVWPGAAVMAAETGGETAPPQGESKEEPTLLEPLEVVEERIEEERPPERAVGKVEREQIEHTQAFTVQELLEETPGIFAKQSNGPRDISLSIRGSGAKTGFAVRNIKVFEDWFPMTQSDGLSRTDINDPHVYEGIDVLRGPSSARYDNYALGGVVNFRSRRGGDIDGVEIGSSGGSFGYLNNYIHIGERLERFEYALFGSYIRGDSFQDYSHFNTVTENFTATITPDEKRTLILKFINNDLNTQRPGRLTLSELRANPRDAGKTFVSGVGLVDTEQAAPVRLDRRTIAGARYEQALDADTELRILGEYDVKDINQSGGVTVNPNFHTYADITRQGSLFGLPAKHYAGLFWNYMEQEAVSFLTLADFSGTRGALRSLTRGSHRNIGARLREEIQWSQRWTGILGVGAEQSNVFATVQSRTGPETFSRVEVDRDFVNVAPEAALVYQHNPDLQAHVRAATGYGIPGISQLTTTPDGLQGNNTDLDTQKNVGLELGIDTRPLRALALNVTGYYEWFIDEFVNQSPGGGLSSFTSNAPRSRHRGVEAGFNWQLYQGWRLAGAYTFNDHVYTDFRETIGPGLTLDRAGKKIPGVESNILNAKLGYESQAGAGGWIEANWVDDFFVNNSNTLKTEAYTVYNLNLHYDRAFRWGFIRGVSTFFEVKNLLNREYIASAIVVADTPADTPANLATTKRAFYAGPDRSYFVGATVKF